MDPENWLEYLRKCKVPKDVIESMERMTYDVQDFWSHSDWREWRNRCASIAGDLEDYAHWFRERVKQADGD